MTVFNGTAGNDTLTGGNVADTFNVSQGGNDTVIGNGGSDLFKFGATFNSADRVSGGAGSDTLQLDGDYSAGVLLSGAKASSIETVQLVTGQSYTITLDNTFVQIGQSFVADGSTLGGSNKLLFDGSAETTSTLEVHGGKANDIIYGGAGDDFLLGGRGNNLLVGGDGDDSFSLDGGAHDVARGGNGNDAILAFNSLDGTDILDGGSGNDLVTLQGSYAAGVSIAAGNWTSIERVVVIDTGIDVALTIKDGVIDNAARMTIDGSSMSGDTLTVDGSDVTTGSFRFIGGEGNDALTGSENSDVFDLRHAGQDAAAGGGGNDLFKMGASWDPTDTLDGGSGTDSLLLNGDYFNGLDAFHISGAMMSGVERMVLTGNRFYNLDTVDDITGGAPLTIDASSVQAGVFFHDMAVQSGDLTFLGSSSGDSVSTGDGNDIVHGNGGDDGLLTQDGNDVAHGAGGDDSIFMGDGDDRSQGGEGDDILHGDAGEDTLLGGTGNDTIFGGLGRDLIRGGAGDDIISAGTGFGDDLGGDLWGGDGADTFKFADSESNGGERGENIAFLRDFDTSSDTILIQASGPITGIDSGVGGTLTIANFKGNLESAAGAGQLAAHHAVFFVASSGDFNGDIFLLVDANGAGGWQPGDYIFQLNFVPGSFTASNIDTF